MTTAATRLFLVRHGATQLTAAISGLNGKDPITQAVNVVEGFSIVFCDLKTLLETGSSANLVRDKAELIAHAMADRK